MKKPTDRQLLSVLRSAWKHWIADNPNVKRAAQLSGRPYTSKLMFRRWGTKP